MGVRHTKEGVSVEAAAVTDESEDVDLYKALEVRFPNLHLTLREFLAIFANIGGTKEFWTSIYNSSQSRSHGLLSADSFVQICSYFSPEAASNNVDFLFRVFDVNNDGVLEDSEIDAFLSNVNASTTVIRQIRHVRTNLGGKTLPLRSFIEICSKHPAIFECCQRMIIDALIVEDYSVVDSLNSFEHQAAGHKENNNIIKLTHTILKRYAEREFRFYEVAQSVPSLIPFLPGYHGRQALRDSETGRIDHYIELEDLTQGMTNPSIMDTKMGRTTSEPTAHTTKRVQQGALDLLSCSDTLGFRISGMRVYQTESGEYVTIEKSQGVALTPSSIEGVIRSYFDNGEHLRVELITQAIEQVKEILEWFKLQKSFRFYGSSLLFVYDGAISKSTRLTVKMVDFAHVVKIRDGSKDDEYKFGLYTLLRLLENIVSESAPLEDA